MTTDILPSDINNKNFLPANRFRFQIEKTPHVNYFCQEVATPSLSVDNIQIPNQLSRINVGGKKLNYSPLTITFKVDEDLKNYIEIFNWIKGYSSPETTDQYVNLIENNQRRLVFNKVENNIYSDGTLFLLTNANNVNLYWNFIDLLPIDISGINMNTQDTDYLSASATFVYTYCDIISK